MSLGMSLGGVAAAGGENPGSVSGAVAGRLQAEPGPEDGDGRAYLKVEPLHAPAIVFETGDTDPTPSSSPCPRRE
jgi:hypothetical protein